MLARRTSPGCLRQRIVRLYQRRWPVAGVRSASESRSRWGIGILPLVPLLLSACTPSTTPMVKSDGVPVGRFQQELYQACGQPFAYPLSPKCIAMMGSAGPMLEHRSVLVMKIWRSCPQDNPCYRITSTDPACAGQTLPAVSDHGGGASDPCLMAQEANYSCAALRNDLVYLERSRQGSEALDSEALEDGCAENKRNLSEYDKRVEEMSVLIQWYRIFANKGF